MIKTDKHRMVKEMMNNDISSGYTGNNQYYIGYIHAMEAITGKQAKELRSIAAKVKYLDHLKYWKD